MGITTGAAQIRMAESLMQGTPLTLFQTRATSLAESAREAAADAAEAVNAGSGTAILGQPITQHTTTAIVEQALRNIVTNVLPCKVLQRCKRFLRRECRKPNGMKVRSYFQHLMGINYSELGQLPPFNEDNNPVSHDELMDILLFGTPKSWQREMDRQGFDPLDNATQEVVSFSYGAG